MKHFKNIILAFFMSLVLFSSSMATVSSEDTPRVQYTANGITTNFPITFAYASISDVHVYFISNSTGLATAWTKDAAGPTGYTVSAGSIIANTAPSNGYLVAVCETPVTQLVDVKPNRALPADTLEGVFDKLTLIGRDLKGTSSRSLVYGPTYTGSIPYAEDLADEIQQDSVDASVAAVSSLSFSTSLHIDNIEALRLYAGGETTSIYLDGHTSINDGGQGPFYWDADSVLADDNGTVVQVTGVAVGRWIRQSSGYFNSAMFGMDRTGATDVTQKFINLLSVDTLGVRNIELLDGTYSVNPRLLLAKVKSNTRLVFSKDAWLVASYGGSDISEVLGVVFVENVEIINPQIVGDADLNPLLTEGAGHCISVRGSTNVKIVGGDISKAFTDGLYLNGNTNLEVSGGDYHGNGRQGISLISGENIIIHDLKCRDSYRAPPMAGIDIEPNDTDTVLKNVRIYNIDTSGNLGGGLLMNIHGINIDVDVIIDGHTDNGSASGARFSSYQIPTHIPTFKPGSRVIYRNGKSIDATNAGMQLLWESITSPHLTLESPWVHNPNRSGGTNDRQQSVGISIHGEVTGYAGAEVGNIDIIHPKITMDGANTIRRGIYAGYLLGTSNLKIIDPLEISIGDDGNLSNSINHELITIGENSNDDVLVTDTVGRLTVTSASSLIRNYGLAVYTNIISTYVAGAVSVTGFQNFGKSKELFITKSNSAFAMTVTLPAGITFIDSAGAVVSTSAVSSTANAVLKFEKVSATMYRVLAITGTWTIT